MRRINTIDDVKQAILHMDRRSTTEEMKLARKSFRDLFLDVDPESLKYMQDEYISFVGVEKEEELIKLHNDPSLALETLPLIDHMKSLYATAEKETGKWFPFVDFIAALNRQIQNLDVVLIETESGYCVIQRANYCIIHKK